MEALQIALWFVGVAILAAGPVLTLVLLRSRGTALPGILKYTVVSVVACSLAFWLSFFAWDYVLELRFRQIVPNGSWTPAEEATWSEAERQIVDQYFGDGGRNVAALFIPMPLVVYSSLVWLIARFISSAARERAV
jgi:hypothetical protein